MVQSKKWDPRRMKAAIEAMSSKEMDSYKASKSFHNLPSASQQTQNATLG
jgi:hypothetical protein